MKRMMLGMPINRIEQEWNRRVCDFHRVNLPAFGFSTTYNTAGTAKVRGSRARQQDLWAGLWVGLWVGIPHGHPRYCIYGAVFYNYIHDLQAPQFPAE